MSVRKYKPTSPALRQMTVLTFEEITKKEPEKSLVVSLKKSGGRNLKVESLFAIEVEEQKKI